MSPTRRPPVRLRRPRTSYPVWRRPGYPVLTGLGLWVLMQASVLLNSPGILVVDIKPEVYLAPWRSFWSYLSPWQADPQLGFPSFNVGLAPVAAFVGLLQSCGASPELSVRILRAGLMTAAALGAARLFRHLSPRPRQSWGPLVAAVVYVANPYTVVAGATLGILLPYAVLPWLMWALVRAVEQGSGWRWPAAVGLLFMATTGMNAGVIALIQLVAAPALVLLARARAGTPWRRVGAVLLRCVAVSLAVSLYWLVPTFAAFAAGEVVVSNSESVTGIASTSSLAEVLRGLGLWPIYGGDSSGPWVPEHVGYLVSVPQVVGSFLFMLVVGLATVLARGRLRLAALAALVVTALLMVGLYPPGRPTVFGRGLSWTFTHVPGLAAFRTTNKAGASLVLAASLLVGAAAVVWLDSQRSRRRRVVAGVALLAALLASAVPALDGNLYISPLQVPGYWRTAAAAVDAGAAEQRVWLVPGEVSANYRWTRERPDDISNSLITRPSLVRTVIPVTAPAAANLLAAADTQLQERSMPPRGLSTYARYLGVGDLLLRNDLVWEKPAGARPGDLQPVVNGDPGLRPAGNFGRPGENTVSATAPPRDAVEAGLPPLQRYVVAGAQDPLRAEPFSGSVVLVGDGYAVTAAQQAGLLPPEAGFRYLADLSGESLREMLGPEHRIVLTDTNRRRTTVQGRLIDGQGPLLAADQDPGPTRTLWSVSDQTVLETLGGTVRASAVGSAFGTFPQAAPENAVDGRRETSWRFGDFRHAPGNHIDIQLDRAQAFDRVVVRTADLGSVRISRVRVSAGGVSADADVAPDGTATVHLGGVRSAHLTVKVLSITGEGFNQVGIAEIEGAGLRVRRVARLPETLQWLAAGMDADERARLARTPVDVVLTRVQGVPDDATDDEEPTLERVFGLPDNRTYRPYGVLQPSADLDEPSLDTLAGADGSVRASSSSRLFDLPTLRASAALDGDTATAWIPGGGVVGESITINASPRVVDHIDVRQARPRDPQEGWASRLRVSLDGRPVAEVAARPGVTRIPVPRHRASSLTLTVLAKRGGGTVRFQEVGFGDARVRANPARARTACVPVARVDGRPLLVHPSQPITTLGPVLFGACPSARLRLAAGTHRVEPVSGWTMSTLVLRDALGEAVVQPPKPPRVTVSSHRPTSYDVTVTAGEEPFTLVLGQAYDRRWRAQMDGRDLGPPALVDGYSAGWTVVARGTHHIKVRYGPEGPSDAALALSILSAVGALVIVTRRGAPGAGLSSAASPTSEERRSRRRPRWIASWLVLWLPVAVGAFLLGGWWLGAFAALLGAGDLVRRLDARSLLVSGLACWTAVPVAWLVGNTSRWQQVTPDLVTKNPWPHVLAGVGLLLLLVGAIRQETQRRSGRLGGDA